MSQVPNPLPHTPEHVSDSAITLHSVDCPCGNSCGYGTNESGYSWKEGTPRCGWQYTGRYTTHDGLDAECTMCSKKIKYEHFMTHNDLPEMGVGCVCAKKLIEIGSATNDTGVSPHDNQSSVTLGVLKKDSFYQPTKRMKLFKLLQTLVGKDLKMVRLYIKPQTIWYVYVDGTTDSVRLAEYDKPQWIVNVRGLMNNSRTN